MNLILKGLAVLVLPFVAACSSVSGLGKKGMDIPAPCRPDLAVAASHQSISGGKKSDSPAFCSLSRSATPACGLLETLDTACESRRTGLNRESRAGDREKSARAQPLKFPVDTGCLSSPFGYRRGIFHHGIDITAPTGTPITACADGKVLCAGMRKGYSHYGKAVIIDHGNGLSTHYAHASAVLVKAGQKVRKGQEIARVGSTGRTTCPHCHLEIREATRLYNPMDYFSEKELHEVKIARNFSNKPAGPVMARSPLAALSRH